MTADTFLALPSVAWTALQALFVLVTGLLIYMQVRAATRGFQFDSIRNMQAMVEDSLLQRRIVFAEFPIELAASSQQFPRRPPSRSVAYGMSAEEQANVATTPEQEAALRSLTDVQVQSARAVINALNDLGQLAEDGYIDRQVFFGKYHEMIIRLCHALELVRREVIEKNEGGNYGQRLLRIRRAAITYHNGTPKHRARPLKLTMRGGEKVIISPIEKSSLRQRMAWALQKQLTLRWPHRLR